MTTPTHTLLILVPLRVDDALPGRAEALRPEGVGGLRDAASELRRAVEATLRRASPSVIPVGFSAHVVTGDGTALACALDEVSRGG